MITAEFTGKNLKGWKGLAREIRASNGERYAASGVVAYSGPEVLVFRMGETGDEPENWGEVAGGRDFTFDEALLDLIAALNTTKEKS